MHAALLISVIESISFTLAFYAVLHTVGNRLQERAHLTHLAWVNLQANEALINFAIESYTLNVRKFQEAFQRAGLSDDSSRKRQLLVDNLGLNASYAAARFALFQAERIHGHPDLPRHEKNLHLILENIKEVYMKTSDLTAEQAEQRIIDEAYMSIAELDFEGKIPFNTSLRNPALEFFRQTVALDKDRQS